MRGARLGLLIGSLSAFAAFGACAINDTGTSSGDSGSDVIAVDVTVNDVSVDGGGGDVVQDYNIPDLGTGETDSGLPCTCVTSIPGLYNVVEFFPTGRPNCTTGYGSHTDLVENPTAGASVCLCTCAASPNKVPTCACGSDPATFDMKCGNGTCATNLIPVAANLNSCYNSTQTPNPGSGGLDNVALHPTTPCAANNGTCSGPSPTNTIPGYTEDQGRSCPLQAGLGTCNTGVCVPTPQSPYSLCVTNNTNDPCPGTFPVTYYVGPSIDDTRHCGPDPCNTCTLGGATCGTPQVSFYDAGNNCTGSVATLPADNSCNTEGWGDTTTFLSTQYSIGLADAGSCSYLGNFTLQGGLNVHTGYNICCL